MLKENNFSLAVWIFFRILGFVYLSAFLSFWLQLPGLFGENGVLPVKILLEAAKYNLGETAYYYYPTLSWISSSDFFLNSLSLAGVLLSLVLISGYITLPATVLLYILYLSIVVSGQNFMSFQWDALLLETGLLSIFIAPRKLFTPGLNSPPPSRILIFLFWFLAFRLMFSSGIGKIISGDPTWRDLTALSYHYYTQPLPNPVAWYVHQLPELFHKVSVVVMLCIETAVPFFFFAPRTFRHVAALFTIILQIIIMITGNYTYFNILSIALCMLFFDDKFIYRFAPSLLKRRIRPEAIYAQKSVNSIRKSAVYIFSAIVIFLGSLQLYTTLFGFWSLPMSMQKIVKTISPLRSFNRYGLFTVMTTSRPEIVIEGSRDGVVWKEYKFRHKPSDLGSRLPIIAPYQPRLDWQMWFAALSNYRTNPWFIKFIEHLGNGTPEVIQLLSYNPFPEDPPRFLRALSYDYTFTDINERKETGNIWKRELIGIYLPEVRVK